MNGRLACPSPWQDAVASVAAALIAAEVERILAEVARRYGSAPDDVREALALCVAADTRQRAA